MTSNTQASQFLTFVNQSPSPFHAVDTLVQKLRTKIPTITVLSERSASWQPQLKAGSTYYTTRNQSSLIAFRIGSKYKSGNGMSIVAAHTDSPCLKLKPRSKKTSSAAGVLQVGVQTYGGGLWHTWFDRDLGVAGRVMCKDGDGNVVGRLVNVKKPILRIPSLAIHLDRSVKDKFEYNSETHLTPILCSIVEDQLNSGSASNGKEDTTQHHHASILNLIAKELKLSSASEIIDFELCLYDVQPSQLGGLYDEFILSARLDNLAMSYCSIDALAESSELDNDDTIRVVALFDNEEVGSDSAYGAGSNMLESFIRRFVKDFSPSASLDQVLANSFMISADMAHALHPNYAEKHDSEHRPQLGQGPVIKIIANQRYATTSVTSTLLKYLCLNDLKTGAILAADSKQRINIQEFVVRNDVPCGSTIGPILSTKLGLRTVDLGWGMLSMHSIREMCASSDISSACGLFQRFFENYAEIDGKFKIDG